MPPDATSAITTEFVANRAVEVYQSSLLPLQTLSIFLTLFFVTSGLYFMIVTGWLSYRVNLARTVLFKTNLSKKRVIKGWKTIKTRMVAGDENSLKLALIEADNILDEALRQAGIQGEGLGDRLKQLTAAQLTNIDDIWQAHKLRNRLVHEANFRLDRDLAERALAIYEAAFQELGILTE